jgi:Glyoxalase/Bleomycin resistance protein/Dioxygenase superfamily
MLERVDRMQLATHDRHEAAATFAAVLGAQKVREDTVHALAAKRTVVRAGNAEFELLEPDGDGPIAAHLAERPEGIYAGGFATPDLSKLAVHLSKQGIQYDEEGDQLFIAPEQTRGMRMVISQMNDETGPGLISHLYEVTNIVSDHQAAAAFYAETFALDAARFCAINSDHWGYVGTLTLFDPPAHLDRIEITQTTQPLAMGRFYERRGESVYMCYAETEDTAPIVRALEDRGARYTAGREDGGGNIFTHPTALCGMLMGISRTNLAWTWSGRPELAKAGR